MKIANLFNLTYLIYLEQTFHKAYIGNEIQSTIFIPDYLYHAITFYAFLKSLSTLSRTNT